MNKLIVSFTNALMRWAERRGRVLKITGTAGPEDVYLIRYYIVKSQYFNFFVHQFLRSDRDDLHDHPWDFCTFLVSGAYTERKLDQTAKEMEDGSCATVESTRRTDKQNRFVFRQATDLHQVVVDRDYKESEKHLAATTLFFSGPTKREWGFFQGASSDEFGIWEGGKWVHWKKYLGLPEDAPNRG
jgi:hypothetical protein